LLVQAVQAFAGNAHEGVHPVAVLAQLHGGDHLGRGGQGRVHLVFAQ
jgi:hypothetical protein